jgi:hypothetical protein
MLAVCGLLWALAPNPYGYYILLRSVVCGISVFLAYTAARQSRDRWAWVMGFAYRDRQFESTPPHQRGSANHHGIGLDFSRPCEKYRSTARLAGTSTPI